MGQGPGLICDRCGRLCSLETRSCSHCGTPVEIQSEALRDFLLQEEEDEEITSLSPDAGSGFAPFLQVRSHDEPEELPSIDQWVGQPTWSAGGFDVVMQRRSSPMESSSARVCSNCRAPVPEGHAFCGKCGAKVEDRSHSAFQTQFFGQMQVPNRARLILIKGEGLDGISYHLNALEHVAGRREGAILFPEDELLSPRHANFYYHEGHIYVKDEGSVNGVFLRLREPVELVPGDIFMAGEEVFRFDPLSTPASQPGADGTLHYHSPIGDIRFQISQLMMGGRIGTIHVDTQGSATVGREKCDINMTQDKYLSGQHCRIDLVDGRYLLTDLKSKNGTYIRIKQPRRLVHGDYLFLGAQLLRVEITM